MLRPQQKLTACSLHVHPENENNGVCLCAYIFCIVGTWHSKPRENQRCVFSSFSSDLSVLSGWSARVVFLRTRGSAANDSGHPHHTKPPRPRLVSGYVRDLFLVFSFGKMRKLGVISRDGHHGRNRWERFSVPLGRVRHRWVTTHTCWNIPQLISVFLSSPPECVLHGHACTRVFVLSDQKQRLSRLATFKTCL